MGQFSMKITRLPGSLPGANQQLLVSMRLTTGNGSDGSRVIGQLLAFFGAKED